MSDIKTFSRSAPLRGALTISGDKSISHRALILSSLALGESALSGLLESEDIFATAAALRAMGARLHRESAGCWRVSGVGVGGLLQPETALDMGNSGTSARLLMGLVSSHALTTTFIGDASLSRRPMERVCAPLRQIGADIQTTSEGHLPLMIRGLCPAVPISYRLPVASAQVKSAILLAGLNIAGVTEIIEPVATRDHSERMLQAFGADITIEDAGAAEHGARRIRLHGEAELEPQSFAIPGDPSSAAFFIAAALLVPDSDIVIRNVGLNPTRCGFIDVLRDMGGDIQIINPRDRGGEPVGDLRVRHSALSAVDVAPEVVPRMIDEFPIFFIVASLAKGQSRAYGLEELRVKESDRLAIMAQGLRAIGATIEEHESAMIIEGQEGDFFRGCLPDSAPIAGHLDHRICMSFAIAGLVSQAPITIDDMRPVATSFPDFEANLANLQAGR